MASLSMSLQRRSCLAISFYLPQAISLPADSRLIEARDLYVNEALLTGEAYPAEKEVAPATAEAAHRDRVTN